MVSSAELSLFNAKYRPSSAEIYQEPKKANERATALWGRAEVLWSDSQKRWSSPKDMSGQNTALSGSDIGPPVSEDGESSADMLFRAKPKSRPAQSLMRRVSQCT